MPHGDPSGAGAVAIKSKRKRSAFTLILLISLPGLLLLSFSAYGIFCANRYRPLVQDWIAANANHELFYLDSCSSIYDAYAMIQPKDIEDMDKNNHPTRRKIRSMLKENNNNPIIARLKFK